MSTEGPGSEEGVGVEGTGTSGRLQTWPLTLAYCFCVSWDKLLLRNLKTELFPVSVSPASSKEPGELCALNKCLLDDETRECTLWNSEKYRARLLLTTFEELSGKIDVYFLLKKMSYKWYLGLHFWKGQSYLDPNILALNTIPHRPYALLS